MLTYWLMYLIVSVMALSTGAKQQRTLFSWILIGFFLTVIIGFRYKVGLDWSNYMVHYNAMDGLELKEALKHGDPGHSFLNWLSYKWNLGIYGINVIYGAIFTVGLIRFSKQQPYPWLTMVVAVPYLLIVVAMGYSRQGVAIGLFLLAITYLNKGRFKTYIVLILIAALFHKTAILLLPLGVFLYGKNLWLRVIMIIPIIYGAWDLLLSKDQEHLWHSYVDKQMQSAGAQIRVAMNLVPALILLKYKKQWKQYFNDYSFWFWIAIGSILSVFFVSVASTAVDRVALYFIPIQLVVFSRLPYLLKKQINPSTMKIFIIISYAIVLFVWLNFAVYSQGWQPYRNILFEGLF